MTLAANIIGIVVIALLFLPFLILGIRMIPVPWVRRVLYALLFAMCITPTAVPVSGLHGALPMPAAWAFLWGATHADMTGVIYGGVPLAVVTLAAFVVLTVIAVVRASRVRPAGAPRTSSTRRD
jgi:hypothetical protein